MKTIERREFLKSAAVAIVMPFIFIPSSFAFNPEIITSPNYRRQYSFQGEIDVKWFIPILDKEIYGNMKMEINGDNYKAEINTKLKETDEIVYSIKSKGSFQNNLLKPQRTITRQKFRGLGGLINKNDETTLIYSYDNDLTDIDISTAKYDYGDNFIGISEKLREHKGINGLDYISAIFQMVLSHKNKFPINQVDLISKMGKSSRHKISQRKRGNYYEFSFFQKTEGGLASIVILLSEESDLHQLSISLSGYGSLNANINGLI